MNLDKPLVSVLMTAYNREKFISEAIESVLTSTYLNFELIIVDDCSKDSTVEIAKSYEAQDKRIRVYNNEINQGDYPNRNTAAGYARGKYLKYVDSDDLIYPHGLEIFVTAMEQFPEAALSFSSRIAQWDKPFPMYLEPNQSLRTHFSKMVFWTLAL
ncbi:MAG: glycosyltransferase family 2 protein [Saprospiraceae bacterium]|nr:glycosyltransferase family 2 protein [Saprospiraceae bacterium]